MMMMIAIRIVALICGVWLLMITPAPPIPVRNMLQLIMGRWVPVVQESSDLLVQIGNGNAVLLQHSGGEQEEEALGVSCDSSSSSSSSIDSSSDIGGLCRRRIIVFVRDRHDSVLTARQQQRYAINVLRSIRVCVQVL